MKGQDFVDFLDARLFTQNIADAFNGFDIGALPDKESFGLMR